MNLRADTTELQRGLRKAKAAVDRCGLVCRKCGGPLSVRNTIMCDRFVRRYRICEDCGTVRRTEER